MSKRTVIQYKPRASPRRRAIFEPDRSTDGWEYGYWRIEEVYETDADAWRETGREHVTEPDVEIASDGLPEAVADA